MIFSYCSEHGIRCCRDYPLRDHTTFRLGGPADFAVFPECAEQAAALVSFLNDQRAPFFVLGRGSDLLVSDSGYRGTVIVTSGLNQIRRDGVRIIADAGVSLAALSSFAAREGLGGGEFLHGIPGSLGGGILMNAGAYGGEIAQLTESVFYADSNGELHTAAGETLSFGYRHSMFSEMDSVICQAVLRFTPGDPAAIRSKIQELDARRREKQPLNYPSAGSAFKRPAGHFAARLIEECGLKGFSVGGACVSEKHSGFIINRGDATAAQVKALIDAVISRVKEQTGIILEPEIRFVGDF